MYVLTPRSCSPGNDIRSRRALVHVRIFPQNRILQESYVYVDWPYCNAAKRLSSVIMTKTDWSSWDKLEWRRRLETFGNNDTSVLASGPNGEVDGVW